MGKTPVAANTPGRIETLDGLRGVGAILILIHHFVVPLIPRTPGTLLAYGHPLLHLTFAGVDLFFVLSGFFIGRELIAHHGAQNFFRVFFLRRALRILPLAFLFVGMVFLSLQNGLYSQNADALRHDPDSPLIYLGFVSNLPMAVENSWGFGPLAPYWALCIEVQFYLVVAALFFWTGPRRIVQLALALIAIGIVSRVIFLVSLPVPHLAMHVLMPCRLDSFGFGLLATWALHEPAKQKKLELDRRHWILCWWVLAAGTGFLSIKRVGIGGYGLTLFGYPVLAAFWTVSLLLLATGKKDQSWVCRLFTLRPMVGVGRYSYFIYLFQGTAIGLVLSVVFCRAVAFVPPATMIEVLVGFAGCYTLGWLSWNGLERPLLAIGQRVRYEPASR